MNKTSNAKLDFKQLLLLLVAVMVFFYGLDQGVMNLLGLPLEFDLSPAAAD